MDISIFSNKYAPKLYIITHNRWYHWGIFGNDRTNERSIISTVHKNIDISLCETDADHDDIHFQQRYDCVKCDNLYEIHKDIMDITIQPSK